MCWTPVELQSRIFIENILFLKGFFMGSWSLIVEGHNFKDFFSCAAIHNFRRLFYESKVLQSYFQGHVDFLKEWIFKWSFIFGFL